MAKTVIGFSIDIEGIDNINKLNAEIKKTEEVLKASTAGTKEFAEASSKLAELKAVQKDLRKEQAALVKEFQATGSSLSAFDKAKQELKSLENQFKSLAIEGKGNSEEAETLKKRISELQGVIFKANKASKDQNRSYKKTSARLVELRNKFKDLAIEGRGSSVEAEKLKKEIKQLDKALKDADKEAGQFGRNVGNYPRIFGLSTKSLGQFIPGLDALSDRLDKATGGSNILGKALIGGFVAFQAGKFLIQSFKQLDELIKKIDETRNAVATFANVGGEQLDEFTASITGLSNTFEVDAQEIGKSAKALSKSLGISFEEAVGKIEEGLLAGQASNEEFLSSIQETPEAFKDISKATGEYSDRQRELVAANKELAAAQIDLANEFAGTTGGLKTFATQAQAFLIKTLLGIIKIFQPVIDGFKEVGAAFGELFGLFGQFNKEAGGTQSIINLLLIPIRNLASMLQVVAQVITAVVSGFTDFVKTSPLLRSIANELIAAFQKLNAAFVDIPNTFAGVIEAVKQVATNFKNFFESSFIDAQIFAARVKGLFTGAVKDELDALRKRRAEINKDGRSIVEAFNQGRQAARDKAAENAAKREKEQIRANAEAAEKERAAVQLEARKKAIEAQRKLQEQLKKDRDKFQADEAAFMEKQIGLLSKLRERQAVLVLEGISDAEEQARAKAKAAQEQRIAQAENDLLQLATLLQKREEEALKLFGAESDELLNLQAENAALLQEAESELDGIRLREKIALQQQLQEIEEQALEARLATRQKELQEQEAISNLNTEAQLSNLQDSLNRSLITEEEYNRQVFEIQKQRLENELKLLAEREEALAKSGVEVSEEQNAQIYADRKRLLAELSGLEKSFADDQVKLAKDTEKKRQDTLAQSVEAFKNQINEIAQGFTQGLDFINQIDEIQEERQIKQLEKREEYNQARTTQLEEQLANASGLEAEYLQQQIDQTAQAAQEIATQREDIEKKRAKRAKRRAVIESIIQTALAVVNALTAGGNPLKLATGVQFLEAGIVGGLGAAQTGIIAAQQFATGGKVGKGNIKRQPNGDNVLATVKTNEVVLTEQHQAALGGPATFAAIGVPGFALGGRVGSPTVVSPKTSALSNNQSGLLDAITATLQATNKRIDNISVTWDANSQSEQDKGLEERDEIRANATF